MAQKWMTSGASRLRARQSRTFGARAQRRAEACAASVAANPLDLSGDSADGSSRAGRKRRRRTAVATIGAIDEIGAESSGCSVESGSKEQGGGVLSGVDEQISAFAGSKPQRNRRMRQAMNSLSNTAASGGLGPRRILSVTASQMGSQRTTNSDPVQAAASTTVVSGQKPKRRSNEDPPYVPPETMELDPASVGMATIRGGLRLPKRNRKSGSSPEDAPRIVGGGLHPSEGNHTDRQRHAVQMIRQHLNHQQQITMSGGGLNNGDSMGLDQVTRSRLERLHSEQIQGQMALCEELEWSEKVLLQKTQEEAAMSAALAAYSADQPPLFSMSARPDQSSVQDTFNQQGQRELKELAAAGSEVQRVQLGLGQAGSTTDMAEAQVDVAMAARRSQGAATHRGLTPQHGQRFLHPYHRSNSMPMSQSLLEMDSGWGDRRGAESEEVEGGQLQHIPVHRSSSMPFANISASQLRVDQGALAGMLAKRAAASIQSQNRDLDGLDAGDITPTSGGISRFQNWGARAAEPAAVVQQAEANGNSAMPQNLGRVRPSGDKGRSFAVQNEIQLQQMKAEAPEKRSVTPQDAAITSISNGGLTMSRPGSLLPKLRYFNNGVEVDVHGVPVSTPALFGSDKVLSAQQRNHDEGTSESKHNMRPQDCSSKGTSATEEPRNVSVVSAPAPAAHPAAPHPSNLVQDISSHSPAMGQSLAPSVPSHKSPPPNALAGSSTSLSDLSPSLPRSCSFAYVLSFVRVKVPELTEALEVIGRHKHGSVDAVLKELYFMAEAAPTMDPRRDSESHLRRRVAGCTRAIEGYKRGLVAARSSEAKNAADMPLPTSAQHRAEASQTSASIPTDTARPAPKPASTPKASDRSSFPKDETGEDTMSSFGQASGDVSATAKTTATAPTTTAGSNDPPVPTSISQQEEQPPQEEKKEVLNKPAQKNDTVQQLQAHQAQIWSMFSCAATEKSNKNATIQTASTGSASSCNGKKQRDGSVAYTTASASGPHSDLINDIFGGSGDGSMDGCKSGISVPKEVDPTPSKLGNDPNKIAQASLEEIVRDSLKEREKTLSAANVLLEFMSASK